MNITVNVQELAKTLVFIWCPSAEKLPKDDKTD